MANDLLTMSLRPPWLPKLLAMATGRENGRLILPAGSGLTSEQSIWLKDRTDDLTRRLSPASGTDAERASIIAGLFASFPAQQLSERTAAARAASYLDMARAYPVWALRQAVKWWNTGEYASPTDNLAFAPSAPQLAKLIRLAMEPIYRERSECRDLLEAKEEVRPDPESKARIDKLLREAGFGPAA